MRTLAKSRAAEFDAVDYHVDKPDQDIAVTFTLVGVRQIGASVLLPAAFSHNQDPDRHDRRPTEDDAFENRGTG